MIQSNQNSVLITSTNRTAEQQAKIMYNNTAQTGVAQQLNLYSSKGDQVINMYPSLSGMTSKINELGSTNISSHLGDFNKTNVFDIAPSSIPKSNQNTFMNAINSNSNIGKFLTPFINPKDTSYHLEVKQPKSKPKN